MPPLLFVPSVVSFPIHYCAILAHGCILRLRIEVFGVGDANGYQFNHGTENETGRDRCMGSLAVSDYRHAAGYERNLSFHPTLRISPKRGYPVRISPKTAESRPKRDQNITIGIMSPRDDAEAGRTRENHNVASLPPATRAVHGHKV
jgi:hypothetical protein